MEILRASGIIKKKYIQGMAYIAVLLLAILIPKLLHIPRFIVVLCGLGCLFVGLINWRWSIYGLLAYIPFAGIPILAMYPSKAPLLFKDVFFIIPAYLGSLGSLFFGHERTSSEGVKGIPPWLICSFAGLVLIHMFNPYLLRRYNFMVGLIGAKVWLFYMPLYFLAYHLINSKEELIKLAKVVLYISVIPFSVGLIQAVLVYSGHDHIVYKFYGPLAGPVTQEFAQFNFPGGGFLRRLPSIFQFGAQYYGYIVSMLPLAAAMWISAKSYWGLVAVLVTVAGLLSGIRRTFIFVPTFWLLFTFLLRRFSSLARLVVGLGMSALLTFSIIEAPLEGIYRHVFGLTARYSQTTISADFVKAVKTAPLGLGAGTDTIPARHALLQPSMFRWLSENFYAKVVYELGLPGLLIIIAIFFFILKRSYIICRTSRDLWVKSFSAAFLSYFILIMIDCSKSSILDLDPANVYFWIYAGMLAKLPSIGAG